MIKISTEEQILFFKENEIVRFETKGNRTIIFLSHGALSELNEPIDSIARQLRNYGFIRVHENHLINVTHITGIPALTPEFIELNNSELIPITKEQKEIIIQLISNHLQTEK